MAEPPAIEPQTHSRQRMSDAPLDETSVLLRVEGDAAGLGRAVKDLHADPEALLKRLRGPRGKRRPRRDAEPGRRAPGRRLRMARQKIEEVGDGPQAKRSPRSKGPKDQAGERASHEHRRS